MDETVAMLSTHKSDGGGLDSTIASAEAELVAERKIRKSSRFVELVVVVVAVLLWLCSRWTYIPDPYWDVYHFGLMIGAAFAALFCLIREVRFIMRAGRHDATLEMLRAKKRFLDQLPSAGTAPETKDYFNALVRINVDNLAGYYNLVKIHTDKSFLVSLAMGIAGFALLAAGLALGFSSSARAETMTYISAGAGTMTEFIAAVFFYLYNRTIRQMKDYHDSLLDVQNVLLALKLVDDTEQSSDRTKMISQTLAYLLTKRASVEHEKPKSAKPELLKATSAA